MKSEIAPIMFDEDVLNMPALKITNNTFTVCFAMFTVIRTWSTPVNQLLISYIKHAVAFINIMYYALGNKNLFCVWKSVPVELKTSSVLFKIKTIVT